MKIFDRTLKVVYATVVLLAMTMSCSYHIDNDITTVEKSPIEIIAQKSDNFTSKATVSGTWDGTESIAIKIGNDVKKYKTGSIGANSATLIGSSHTETHYWQGGNPVSISAWASGEYSTTLNAFGGHMDQTTELGFNNADLIYAPATTWSLHSQSGLTFYHQMARIKVNIKDAGIAAGKNPSTINLTFGDSNNNICLYGTFDPNTINLSTGKISGLTGNDKLQQGYVKPKKVATTAGNICSYEVLLIPQTMAGKKFIAITFEGNTYYYSPTANSEDAEIKGGVLKEINITLQNRNLEITSSNITSWTDATGGSGFATEK